ncbi:MAG: hypothetical protein ACRC1W_11765 [Shewanella sp.]
MFTIFLLVITPLVLLGLWKRYRSPKRHQHHHKTSALLAEKPKLHHFHSVSIINNGSCCETVEALTGKRFLSKEAPEIPMEKCTNAHCQCRYQHHEDRRQPGNDRRVEFGVTKELFGAFGEQNRRDKPTGRRTTDS